MRPALRGRSPGSNAEGARLSDETPAIDAVVVATPGIDPAREVATADDDELAEDASPEADVDASFVCLILRRGTVASELATKTGSRLRVRDPTVSLGA